jgi:PAS domain S-box-containing protein
MEEAIVPENLLAGLGSALLKSIRDPFAIMGKDFICLWANKAMAVIHQSEREDVAGKVCYEAFYGNTKPCPGCAVQEVYRTGRTQVQERWLDFPDGTRRWGEVKAYPVRGSDRSLVAVIVIVFDITERKKDLETQKEYSGYLTKQLDEKSGMEHTVYLDEDRVPIKVRLSGREKEVLRLITEGYTNMQISEILAISPHTVKSHVIHLFNKLGANDRTQTAVLAVRHKLI